MAATVGTPIQIKTDAAGVWSAAVVLEISGTDAKVLCHDGGSTYFDVPNDAVAGSEYPRWRDIPASP